MSETFPSFCFSKYRLDVCFFMPLSFTPMSNTHSDTVRLRVAYHHWALVARAHHELALVAHYHSVRHVCGSDDGLIIISHPVQRAEFS